MLRWTLNVGAASGGNLFIFCMCYLVFPDQQSGFMDVKLAEACMYLKTYEQTGSSALDTRRNRLLAFLLENLFRLAETPLILLKVL